MTEPGAQDAAAWAAAAVRGYLAAAGMYLAAVAGQNPRLPVSQLLQRPDVEESLDSAFTESSAYVTQEVRYAWESAGGDETADLRRLLGDVRDAHRSLPQLRAALRTGKASPRETIERFARQLALRSSMTVAHAAAASTLQRELAGARARYPDGTARKRWKAHPQDPSCCFWCRRLHGVTIALDADFAPHLGGPAALSATGRLTRPPRPYGGHLPGPPLHPNCECDIEIIAGGEASDVNSYGGQVRSPVLPYLAASGIRALSPARYRLLMEFLRAAAHELGQVLERLARDRTSSRPDREIQG